MPDAAEGELVVRWGGPGGPRHGFFSGYLKNAAGDRGGVARRLVPHGRRRAPGGGRHAGVRRQEEEHHPPVGENIAAAEVEAALQAHEAVGQVAVLAVPDELREEEVMACVVVMPAAARDVAAAEGLVRFCLDRLAYYKAPGWVLFVDALPTTGTQKVQKAQIFPPGSDPRRQPGAIDLRALKRRG